MESEGERFQKGLATLMAVQGESDAQGLVRLHAVAPDLARWAIDAFDDIYATPSLDAKTREIATVAALVALGTAPAQLRGHINGAFNVGCTRAEIVAAASIDPGLA